MSPNSQRELERILETAEGLVYHSKSDVVLFSVGFWSAAFMPLIREVIEKADKYDDLCK